MQYNLAKERTLSIGDGPEELAIASELRIEHFVVTRIQQTSKTATDLEVFLAKRFGLKMPEPGQDRKARFVSPPLEPSKKLTDPSPPKKRLFRRWLGR